MIWLSSLLIWIWSVHVYAAGVDERALEFEEASLVEPERGLVYHFGRRAESVCSEGTLICLEEHVNDKVIKSPILERGLYDVSARSLSEDDDDKITLLLRPTEDSRGKDVEVELGCDEAVEQVAVRAAWRSYSTGRYAFIGTSRRACTVSPPIQSFEVDGSDSEGESGSPEEGLVDPEIHSPAHGRRTAAIVLSSLGLIAVAFGAVLYFPPSFLRNRRLHRISLPKISLSRTGEGKLVQWAEEDMGFDEEQDVMVNGGGEDEDPEAPVEYDEYIPLKPSPRRHGPGKLGFQDYGSASAGGRRICLGKIGESEPAELILLVSDRHIVRGTEIISVMSWGKLGGNKGSGNSRSATPISRSTTPMPAMEGNQFRNGMLTISIYSGRGLHMPPNTPLPDCIQKALANPQQQIAGGSNRHSNRESMQRRRYWWLPYVVLEFDKNEILVDAMAGDLTSPVWNYKADFDVSRTSSISVSAYLRTAPVQGPDDMGNDLLIARVDLMPVLDSRHASDEWYPATSPPTATNSSFHLKIDFRPASREGATLTIDSFDLLKVIGKGSFGKVMQVRKKDTSRIYALKTIRKAHIAQRPGEITHILAERTVLALVNNPFIVPLKFSFQNPDKLYLVMSFVNGGELFYHLQREGKFDEARSRFYAAELLSALEHLHGFNVVYRDLKPENILLDYTGHIALCDFGLCKLNMSETDKTNTFCGTPEYIAPELLESQGYTKTVDWWTLGVLLYEMMTGLPPFYDENVNTMYQRILSDPLTFPNDMPSDARSVMTGLLVRDPSKRLGAQGAEEIKRHPFFARHIDWNKLLAKKIPPPFKPSVESVLDVANFDPDFTNEEAQDSVVTDSALSETVQDQFRGFTYNPANEHLSESVSYGGAM